MAFISQQSDTEFLFDSETNLTCPKKPTTGHTDFFNLQTNKWEKKPTQKYLQAQQNAQGHTSLVPLFLNTQIGNHTTTASADPRQYTNALHALLHTNHSQINNTNVFIDMFSDDEDN